MKVKIEEPYPQINVESKNEYYANLLLENYAGKISELTLILLFTYQYFNISKNNETVSNVIKEISQVSMKHLELLSEIILLLGKEPVYKTSGISSRSSDVWTSDNINYTTDIKQMLLIDIKAKKVSIRNYVNNKNLIDDKYIKEILTRIILDEERHLEILELLYNDLKNKLNFDN